MLEGERGSASSHAFGGHYQNMVFPDPDSVKRITKQIQELTAKRCVWYHRLVYLSDYLVAHLTKIKKDIASMYAWRDNASKAAIKLFQKYIKHVN